MDLTQTGGLTMNSGGFNGLFMGQWIGLSESLQETIGFPLKYKGFWIFASGTT